MIEGSTIASYGGAYSDFEQQVIHADWQRTKQVAYTHQVVAATHPIAAGLPATFVVSGYPGRQSWPDMVLPAHGWTLVIQFQNVPGTGAVFADSATGVFLWFAESRDYRDRQRAQYLCCRILSTGYCKTATTGGLRSLTMGYGLGTSVGQTCPVHVRVKNFGATETGQVKFCKLQRILRQWTAVDSATFNRGG